MAYRAQEFAMVVEEEVMHVIYDLWPVVEVDIVEAEALRCICDKELVTGTGSHTIVGAA